MIIKLLTFILLILATTPAYAFQCPPRSVETQFETADRVFLAYVTDTRLEEALMRQENIQGDNVKMISTGYRIIEDFKGNKNIKPRLLDMLGIGIGHVALTPGVYYLVLLPKSTETLNKELQLITICDVHFSHYRMDIEEMQNKLNMFRNMKRALRQVK